MNFLAKTQAIHLRRKGKSYSEIKERVKVSKSTLSGWLKDIELTREQESRLSKLQATGYAGAKKQQAASLKHHEEIKKNAECEAAELVKDPFFVAGLMLYWAEGSKNFGSVQFSNSDPAMIKIMMRWFRSFCAVSEDKFRISLFIHSLHTKEDCQKFWQDVTSIPPSQFYKPYIKPTIYSNRKNKLYEGTCRIIIHQRDLLSKIIGWKNGVEKIFQNKIR
jgi:transcriptional regulator with XRE-family HTH domain